MATSSCFWVFGSWAGDFVLHIWRFKRVYSELLTHFFHYKWDKLSICQEWMQVLLEPWPSEGTQNQNQTWLSHMRQSFLTWSYTWEGWWTLRVSILLWRPSIAFSKVEKYKLEFFAWNCPVVDTLITQC